eukprot:TRINITY_DN10344_c0_g1_i1.p1 TRINITY_DN10344_c0_g1~~TRINITY_DN10344_c0_g1_i1.p1  ORF type:complete len:628 (-),score=144.43 TRINITY_DN10344_c0_g1_i1:440-2278(-)
MGSGASSTPAKDPVAADAAATPAAAPAADAPAAAAPEKGGKELVVFDKADYQKLLDAVEKEDKKVVAGILSKANTTKAPEAPKHVAPTAESMGLDVEAWHQGKISIIVLGATGDLAKKETFPALLDLYAHDYLQKECIILGYGRKQMTTEDMRKHLAEELPKSTVCREMLECIPFIPAFLEKVQYCAGKYDSADDMAALDKLLTTEEDKFDAPDKKAHRVFYFAIPPFVFLGAAKAINDSARAKNGFTRLIVEKPFGHDLKSASELQDGLGALFKEEEICRMDHFLGYEICQNILSIRFGNIWLNSLMNNHNVASVRISLKENFGTEGRGGYFTKYGIIRDVIQNHLLQVLCLVAMEKPSSISPEADVRDAKVTLLKQMLPFDEKEVVLGQYTGADGKPGYLEDDSIAEADRETAKYCPTFCQMVARIDNDRWRGVPFIIRAGKGIDASKCEVRIQFKNADPAPKLFGDKKCPRNELVMRVSPDEAIYMKMNVKSPGLAPNLLQSEMDLSYGDRYPGIYTPSAYTRLILAGIRGISDSFVRNDELMRSWELYSPLLESLEGKKELPIPYARGSRGPLQADEMLEKLDCIHEPGYVWRQRPQTDANFNRLMTK